MYVTHTIIYLAKPQKEGIPLLVHRNNRGWLEKLRLQLYTQIGNILSKIYVHDDLTKAQQTTHKYMLVLFELLHSSFAMLIHTSEQYSVLLCVPDIFKNIIIHNFIFKHKIRLFNGKFLFYCKIFAWQKCTYHNIVANISCIIEIDIANFGNI